MSNCLTVLASLWTGANSTIDGGTIGAAAAGATVVSVVVVMFTVVVCVAWAKARRQKQRPLRRMNTPEALVLADETSNDIPMASEAGIGRSVILDAEEVMPPASAAELEQVPVAVGQP